MIETFLATELEKRLEASVKIFTVFTNQSPEFLLEHVESENDLIIFYEYFSTKASSYLHKYFEVAKFLKSHITNPLFFGGFWATTHTRPFREFDIFDYIFEGYSIDKIVDAISEFNYSFPRYIDTRGSLYWNKYDFSLDYVHDKQANIQYDTFWGYISSFGCPLDCKFCFVNSARNDGTELSVRKANRVKEDLELIINSYPSLKAIVFKDMNFFFNKKRAFEILDFVKEKGLEIAINLDVTVLDIDEEFIIRLKEHGTVPQLYFGLESFNEETRRKVGKYYSTEQMENVFEIADRHNIRFTGNIILGLPWQTKDEVEDAIRQAIFYMRKYKNVYVAMNVYKPEIGTEIQMRYFEDIDEKLTFNDVIELYKNNVSQFQDHLHGDKFNFIDFEKVNSCIRVIMKAKSYHYQAESRNGKRILKRIRTLYEDQLTPPYFRSKIISFTLTRQRSRFIGRYIIPLFTPRINQTFIKKLISMVIRTIKGQDTFIRRAIKGA
ncbi:B12-binding domain-containing radical SAM protein [Chloroflexota bacterium]